MTVSRAAPVAPVADAPVADNSGDVERTRLREVSNPSSLIARFAADQPLRLDCQQDLGPFDIAYQTYGRLNADKSNAILICHALTGDQHVANDNPITGKPGWWEIMIGPGKPIDTDRFFVISTNVLGGCYGSTGPASINPQSNEPYGLDFPVITIARHGARPGPPDRPSRHQAAVFRDRRLDGRHAGARVGSGLQGSRVHRHADRHRRLAFLAEHRLPRGRAAGDHGRSRMAARPLSGRRHIPQERPVGRAHGRPHHLPVRGSAAAQIRPQPAGSRRENLLVQRRFPGRELSAPSGHRPSSTASTPTATSTSPAPWTIST